MKILLAKQAQQAGVRCKCYVSRELLNAIEAANDTNKKRDTAVYDIFPQLLDRVGSMPDSIQTIFYPYLINTDSMLNEPYMLQANIIGFKGEPCILITSMESDEDIKTLDGHKFKNLIGSDAIEKFKKMKAGFFKTLNN